MHERCVLCDTSKIGPPTTVGGFLPHAFAGRMRPLDHSLCRPQTYATTASLSSHCPLQRQRRRGRRRQWITSHRCGAENFGASAHFNNVRKRSLPHTHIKQSSASVDCAGRPAQAPKSAIRGNLINSSVSCAHVTRAACKVRGFVRNTFRAFVRNVRAHGM